MILILLIIFGIFCFAAGEYHAEHREECADEINGYYCRRGDSRYSVGCDHSEVGVLKAKLARAEWKEEHEAD